VNVRELRHKAVGARRRLPKPLELEGHLRYTVCSHRASSRVGARASHHRFYSTVEGLGIVSRADLLRAVAARRPQPEPAPKPDDRAIRDRLLETIHSTEWITAAFVNVMVTDAVVHLWEVVESDAQRDALRVAAERIPGVRAVEDHLEAAALVVGGVVPPSDPQRGGARGLRRLRAILAPKAA
jgi:hypothetical protein